MNALDVKLNLRKKIADKKLLSKQVRLNNLLKEHEQRKKAIKKLVKKFKASGEKGFSRIRKNPFNVAIVNKLDCCQTVRHLLSLKGKH
jgi:hypothetical protein